MINATFGGQTYNNVDKLIATDGTNSAEVTLSESGVIPTPTQTINIGNDKNNTTVDVKDYAYAAVAISGGGDTPTGTKEITISENKTTTEDVTNFANVKIITTVPNTYAAGDEGKVVSNGALVSQGSHEFTSNDTYDTTLYNSVKVNVPGGGVQIDDIATGAFPANLHIGHVNIIRDYCFGKNSSIEHVFWEGEETSGGSLFRGATALQTFVAPNALVLTATYMFADCADLEAVDLGPNFHGGMPSNGFQNCTVLDTLVFRRADQVLGLNNVSVFNSTPFASGGTGGTIYLAHDMYTHLGDGTNMDYQAASNWSTLYTAGTITFADIQGSQYATHYVDGTQIGS